MYIVLSNNNSKKQLQRSFICSTQSMKNVTSLSLLCSLAALPVNADVYSFMSHALSAESNFVVTDSGASSFGDSSVTFQQSDNSGWWNGFTYSNRTDAAFGSSSVGLPNEYTAITGAGAGDTNYGIFYKSSYGGADRLQFGSRADLNSIDLTNTTYSYYALLYGADGWSGIAPTSSFVGKNADNTYEGGFTESLTDYIAGDYFRVTASGYRDGSMVETDTFDLAYWDGDSFEISSDWETWNLGFTNIDEVAFAFTGTDSGTFGLNTPSYMAVDNINFTTVPEPSAFALLLGAVALGCLARRRR
jgi:hypothetical protein